MQISNIILDKRKLYGERIETHTRTRAHAHTRTCTQKMYDGTNSYVHKHTSKKIHVGNNNLDESGNS